MKFPAVAMLVPSEMRMSIDQLVDVIDHWVCLVGDEHVALGSDLDGHPALPREMKDIGDMGQMLEAVRRRGYSEERVGKIAGLNLLRLIRQVTEKS
jgi:membrane dipeptidase